jgi:outer membrane protein assembly factor BamB
VILSRDGAPEGAILVLDATDGSELTSINRFGFGESHGTPFLWRNAGRDELVVGGNGTLSSYDLASGELLWNYKGTTAFPCTTPTADAETLYFAAWSTPNATGRSFWEAAFDRSLDLTDAETDDPALLFARLDTNGDGKILREELPECRAKDAFGVLDENENGSWEKEEFVSMAPPDAAGKNLLVAVARGGQGELGASHVRWTWERGLPYVSSPLLYRERLWLFQSGGLVSVLDAKTGEALIDRERLPDRAEYYLSPVGAAGHVLVGSAEGTLYLLSAAVSGTEPALTIEHTTTFDEGLFATPAVLDGVVYLRTATTQWAFALPAK